MRGVASGMMDEGEEEDRKKSIEGSNEDLWPTIRVRRELFRAMIP